MDITPQSGNTAFPRIPGQANGTPVNASTLSSDTPAFSSSEISGDQFVSAATPAFGRQTNGAPANLPPEHYGEIVQQLRGKYDRTQKGFKEARDQQGWLGKIWDSTKNTIGGSPEGKSWYNPAKWWGSVVNADRGSASVEDTLQEAGASLERMEALSRKAENGSLSAQEQTEFQRLYRAMGGDAATGGVSADAPGGESKSLLDKADNAVSGYKESQENGVDLIADVAAGVTTAGVITVGVVGGVLAAPFTGGASLAASAATIGAAAGVGAATKALIKGTDAASGGREYGLKDVAYDVGTGAVIGAITPVATVAGGAVRHAGTRMISNTAFNRVAQAGVQFGTEGALDGFVTGGTGEFGRTLYHGGTFTGALKQGAFGAGMGLMAGGVLGGGMGVTGKTLRKGTGDTATGAVSEPSTKALQQTPEAVDTAPVVNNMMQAPRETVPPFKQQLIRETYDIDPQTASLDDLIAARSLDVTDGGGKLAGDLDILLRQRLNDPGTSVSDIVKIGEGSPALRAQVDEAVNARMKSGFTGRFRTADELSGEDIAALARHQAHYYSAAEVDELLQKVPAENREMAAYVLRVLTRYGSLESMDDLGGKILNITRSNKGTLYYLPDSPGLAGTLKYLGKKTDYRMPHNIKPLDISASSSLKGTMLVDDAFLDRLATDEVFRQWVRLNPNIKLIRVSGLNHGITPFNQAKLSSPEFAKTLNELAEEATALTKNFQAPTKDALANHALEKRMLNILEDALGKDRARWRIMDIEDVLHGPASSRIIAAQLDGPAMPGHKLDEMFDQLGLKPEARDAAREMLARNLAVVSPREMSELSQQLHRRIVKEAADSGIPEEKIFYVRGFDDHNGAKSGDLVTHVHTVSNGIPPSRIISMPLGETGGTMTLPPGFNSKNSMMVMLDDVAGSGETLLTMHGKVREVFDGKVVIAPWVGTDSAAKAFNALPENSRYFAGRDLPSFSRSEYFNSLTDDQKLLYHELFGGHEGFGYSPDPDRLGDALSLSFPYMGPNNNNAFSQLVAFHQLSGQNQKALKLPKRLRQYFMKLGLIPRGSQ